MRRLLALALAGGLGLTALAAPAIAGPLSGLLGGGKKDQPEATALATVSCGQVLTASTTLDNDLNNCSGDGLVAGASGITINLNGRTIDGSDAGAGVRTGGFDKVVISGGTIKEFNHGLRVQGGNGVQVKNVRVHSNTANGVLLNNAAAAQVSGATTESNGGAGIAADSTFNLRLIGNRAGSNGQLGIYLLGCSGTTTLQSNTAQANAGAGILLDACNDTVSVKKNVANGNGTAGIDSANTRPVTVAQNTANYNDDLGIRAHPATVDGGKNEASGNGNAKVCENVVCSPSKGA